MFSDAQAALVVPQTARRPGVESHMMMVLFVIFNKTIFCEDKTSYGIDTLHWAAANSVTRDVRHAAPWPDLQ